MLRARGVEGFRDITQRRFKPGGRGFAHNCAPKTLEQCEDHALCLTQVENVTNHRDIVEPAETTAVSPERALSVLPLPVNHPVSQRCHRQSANSLKAGSRGSLLHPWGLAEGLLARAFRQATQAALHAAPTALRQKQTVISK